MPNDVSTLWNSIPFSGIVSVCAAYCAIMMLLICLLMYSRQRKKAYLFMAAAFFFIMTYEGLNIHQSFSGQTLLPNLEAMRPLQLFSLVLLNLSVLLLYRRVRRAYYGMTAIAAVLLIVPLFLPPDISPLWPKLYWDGMEWLIIFLSFAKIAPVIGQRRKYSFGLAIYSVWAAVHNIHSHLYPGEDIHGALQFTAVLPLAFYSIIFFILFQRIIELMQSIYRSSITDGLTGLYNRRYFMKHLNQFVAQGLKISAIFCDIDNFKKLNDTQGHAKADEVLKQVASIMEEELEGVGLTGRYGGEELVALVVSRGSQAAQIAERIRFRVAEETMVTVSVGYSSLRKGVTGDGLMKQADEAMYHSKTTGKNRVTDYHSLGRPSKAQEAAN
ncbi:GGDEF domain-containing protein [Paenibacillus sp. DMB20]|uniref:GGDEF domain-containing protein n=1 Tax=Paenibacillus sp. DMB20 TaxID=1642570 RepID=UPI000B04EF2F|nr:GGDEF domain-containing protein [Paenibacillus sp. DMB20]